MKEYEYCGRPKGGVGCGGAHPAIGGVSDLTLALRLRETICALQGRGYEVIKQPNERVVIRRVVMI